MAATSGSPEVGCPHLLGTRLRWGGIQLTAAMPFTCGGKGERPAQEEGCGPALLGSSDRSP